MDAGEFVWALIERADSPLLEAELARILRAELAPARPSPREHRLADLWFLRDLIDTSGESFPQRRLYDERRVVAGALTSHSIVHRYGTWWEACSIAVRMEPDGKLPRGRTFSGGRVTRGRPRAREFTIEEAVGAARLCAFSLAVRPTSLQYYDWSELQRRTARERGIERRIPAKTVLRRLFPGPRVWERVLAAAAITDSELQTARAAFLHRPSEAQENPFFHLPVREASILAVGLKGSLDWLAGRTCERTPIPEAPMCFSAKRFFEVRGRSPVAPARLAAAAGLNVGQARRLLTGSYEPTLGQLVTLASVLGVGAGDLCAAVPGSDSGQNRY